MLLFPGFGPGGVRCASAAAQERRPAEGQPAQPGHEARPASCGSAVVGRYLDLPASGRLPLRCGIRGLPAGPFSSCRTARFGAAARRGLGTGTSRSDETGDAIK